ncbi:MAG TPA: ABC transporter ATP-binding protein, partial [Trueperaceae bacterium]
MKAPPPLLAPRRPETFAGMGAALANAALRVALVPVFVTPMFDQVLATNSVSALPRVLLVSAIVVVLGAIMLFVQDAYLGRAAAVISAAWREYLYACLLRQRPGSLPGTSGGLSSRIIGDLKEVEMFHQFGLGSLVAEAATALAILVMLLSYNTIATLLLLAAGLPLTVVLRWLGHRLETQATKSEERREQVGSHLQEGFRHHDEVRAYRADAFMLARLRPANAGARRAGIRRSRLAGLQTPTAQVLMFAAVGLLVLLLVRSVLAGAMTVGELVGYLTLVALLATPLQLFPRGYALYRQARAAARRLQALLGDTQPPTPTSEASPNPLPTARASHHGAALELQGLSF